MRLPCGSTGIFEGLCLHQHLPFLPHLGLIIVCPCGSKYKGRASWASAGTLQAAESCWGLLTSWGNLNQDWVWLSVILLDVLYYSPSTKKSWKRGSGTSVPVPKGTFGDHFFPTRNLFPQSIFFLFALFYPLCKPNNVTTHTVCHQGVGETSPTEIGWDKSLGSRDHWALSWMPIFHNALNPFTKTSKFMFSWISLLLSTSVSNKHLTLVHICFWTSSQAKSTQRQIEGKQSWMWGHWVMSKGDEAWLIWSLAISARAWRSPSRWGLLLIARVTFSFL